VPSIFSGPLFGSPATDAITVTEGGGRFTFGALDLAANNGNVNFTFTGTLLGAPVFNVTGTQLTQPAARGVANDYLARGNRGLALLALCPAEGAVGASR
jgi:hypothetical protein